ncbi:MAG: TerB family tellurite resistance protein [bacterium]|nr:TerB family tellurite resistance protein [bacterium]
MGLLGTLVGGSLGFMMFGPFGAIVGGAIGANIGESGPRPSMGGPSNYGPTGYNQRPYGNSAYGAPVRDARQAQQAFLVAMISLAAKVAKADGRVTEQEVRSFDAFLRDRLGMSPEDRRVAASLFNQARDSAVPAEEFARQIRALIGHEPDRLRDLMALLMSVAAADAGIDQAEDRLLRSIAREMGLNARDYEAAAAMFDPRRSIDASYAVLGVTRDATDEEVKKAYRRLAREHHPDVVVNKGMGEDFRKFADEKMRAINAAYDAVKESRGL